MRKMRASENHGIAMCCQKRLTCFDDCNVGTLARGFARLDDRHERGCGDIRHPRPRLECAHRAFETTAVNRAACRDDVFPSYFGEWLVSPTSGAFAYGQPQRSNAAHVVPEAITIAAGL